MSPPPRTDTLHGRRVLILEDSFLIAQDLATAVANCGCVVLGPASSVKKALEILDRFQCDGAILDINLGAAHAGPVADLLSQRGIPFLFLTGYSEESPLGDHHADVPLLQKPVDPSVLCDALRAAIATPPSGASTSNSH